MVAGRRSPTTSYVYHIDSPFAAGPPLPPLPLPDRRMLPTASAGRGGRYSLFHTNGFFLTIGNGTTHRDYTGFLVQLHLAAGPPFPPSPMPEQRTCPTASAGGGGRYFLSLAIGFFPTIGNGTTRHDYVCPFALCPFLALLPFHVYALYPLLLCAAGPLHGTALWLRG